VLAVRLVERVNQRHREREENHSKQGTAGTSPKERCQRLTGVIA